MLVRLILNLIKKAITTAYAIIFVFSLCALDSASWIPFIVFVICTVILGIWAYFNVPKIDEYEWEFEDDVR